MSETEDIKTKLDKNVVFIHHSIKFMNPGIPNTAESFGLNESTAPKELMTLGRFKVFPKEVWEEVFGSWDESPLYKLNTVRSQLQQFIDNYTYPFLAGFARALPYGKLVPFIETADMLKERFKKAQHDYLENIDELVEASIGFWSERSHHVFKVDFDIIEQAIRVKFCDYNAMQDKFAMDIVALKIESIETGEVDIADIDEARSIVEARDKLAEDSRVAIKEQTDDFQKNIVTELRTRIHAAYADLSSKVESKQFNQKSINTLKRIMSDFSSMNFMGDKKLEAFIADNIDKLDGIKAKLLKGKGAESDLLEFLSYVNRSTEELDELKTESVDGIVASFVGESEELALENAEEIKPPVKEEVAADEVEEPDPF
jgi:hypothetical protein